MYKLNLPTENKGNNPIDNLPLGPMGPIVEEAGTKLGNLLSDIIDKIFDAKGKK